MECLPPAGIFIYIRCAIPEGGALEAGAKIRKNASLSGGILHFSDCYQVFLTNFSLQRGQVMEILPFPLGTRTGWWHLGQEKYL